MAIRSDVGPWIEVVALEDAVAGYVIPIFETAVPEMEDIQRRKRDVSTDGAVEHLSPFANVLTQRLVADSQALEGKARLRMRGGQREFSIRPPDDATIVKPDSPEDVAADAPGISMGHNGMMRAWERTFVSKGRATFSVPFPKWNGFADFAAWKPLR